MSMTEERRRLETIVYYALWQLRDSDPENEPAYVRMTRLEFHDRLSAGLEEAAADEPEPPPRPRKRHLTAVK